MPVTPKPIAPHERLIFAMDVADPDAARRLADRLGDSVGFYKLGLELFMSGGYFELLDWMVGRGKQVFVDLKFFDVPATVGAAVKQLRNRGVTLTTVHGNQAMMEAAAAATTSVSPATSRSWCCRAPGARSRRAATASSPRASRRRSCANSSTTACWW
jgi:orotidine-5'-phosphate decarboxylase